MGIQRTIGIRVSIEMFKQLDQQARRQGQTLTAFAREILQREALRMPPVLEEDSPPYGPLFREE